ncbi:MAG: YibE/F family protein [Candidatus Uhrbacteria bacterium]
MKYFVTLVLALVILWPLDALAQTDSFNDGTVEARAVVERVVEEQLDPPEEAWQVVEVRINQEGEYDNRLFTVDSREGNLVGLRHEVKDGQEVKVLIVPASDYSAPVVFITDVVRLNVIMLLLILFVVVTLAIGLLRGFSSLIGLGVIMLVLFGFILPQLINGHSPILITLIGSAVILAVSIFGTHGFRKPSWAAFLGTISGLVITGILALIFVQAASLTGLASDEAATLQLKTGLSLNAQGLLLAAIIIGALGVLDDVTVTQSTTVFELAETDPTLSKRQLARRAMRIGRHHIASMVNTLVLAYAGASLPLLLLFLASDQSTLGLLNSELIAEEVVRTLVGTIGLIAAVPLATWFAVIYAKRDRKKFEQR